MYQTRCSIFPIKEKQQAREFTKVNFRFCDRHSFWAGCKLPPQPLPETLRTLLPTAESERQLKTVEISSPFHTCDIFTQARSSPRLPAVVAPPEHCLATGWPN